MQRVGSKARSICHSPVVQTLSCGPCLPAAYDRLSDPAALDARACGDCAHARLSSQINADSRRQPHHHAKAKLARKRMEVHPASVTITVDEEDSEEIISDMTPECVRELPAVIFFVTV